MRLFFIFFIGAILGSLGNTLAHRLPKSMPVFFVRSQCPQCQTTLSIHSLIPLLSFIFQKGKCLMCKQSISIRYFLLEFFLGFLFVGVYLWFGLSVHMVLVLCFVFLTAVLFVTDLETFLLPSSLLVLLGILGCVQAYLSTSPSSHFLGFFVGGGIFLLIRTVSNWLYKTESMGFGDVILTAVISLFLGLTTGLMFLYLSFFIGGLLGVLLLILTDKSRRDAIPFGPVLIVASYLSLIIGPTLWKTVAASF